MQLWCVHEIYLPREQSAHSRPLCLCTVITQLPMRGEGEWAVLIHRRLHLHLTHSRGDVYRRDEEGDNRPRPTLASGDRTRRRITAQFGLMLGTHCLQRPRSVPRQSNRSSSLIAALNAQSHASDATSARLARPPPRPASTLPRLASHYRSRTIPRNRCKCRGGSKGRFTNCRRCGGRTPFLIPRGLEYLQMPLEPRLQREINKKYAKLITDSAKRLVSAHQPLEF
ncbi:hypothetical protein TcWFU_005101 [Taenia crassiceps]|uniref:Uncharacterized protein n=1 Tax=Taenia crassiceps TaxID=6207 RepID=A0ABR4QGZ7_9CEST